MAVIVEFPSLVIVIDEAEFLVIVTCAEPVSLYICIAYIDEALFHTKNKSVLPTKTSICGLSAPCSTVREVPQPIDFISVCPFLNALIVDVAIVIWHWSPRL